MYKADKLYNEMMAVDTAIKQMKVEDEASLAEYFRHAGYLRREEGRLL